MKGASALLGNLKQPESQKPEKQEKKQVKKRAKKAVSEEGSLGLNSKGRSSKRIAQPRLSRSATQKISLFAEQAVAIDAKKLDIAIVKEQARIAQSTSLLNQSMASNSETSRSNRGGSDSGTMQLNLQLQEQLANKVRSKNSSGLVQLQIKEMKTKYGSVLGGLMKKVLESGLEQLEKEEATELSISWVLSHQ